MILQVYNIEVGSYLNLGGQVVLANVRGHNLPPLVEIGLSDLSKPGWAIAHSAHPSPTSLYYNADIDECDAILVVKVSAEV